MGQGASSKPADSASLFSAESQRRLAVLFQHASSGKSDWCQLDNLQRVLGRVLDERSAGGLCWVMWRDGGKCDAASRLISHSAFVRVASSLLHSSAGNHTTLIWQLVVSSCSDDPQKGEEKVVVVEVSAANIRQYISSVVGAYIRLTRGRIPEGKSGSNAGESDDLSRVTDLLLHDLLSDRMTVSRDMFDKWLTNSGLFTAISVVLYHTVFSLDIPEPYRHVLPSIDAPVNYSLLLRSPELLVVNWSLPYTLRHRWRLLFSNRIHGNSFSSMLKRIQNCGPSVVILRDTEDAVFGGFASASWKCAANFFGTQESCLFSISPSMRVYQATGYNDNYLYINASQQTLPNGMGFGGKFEYFGLWISSEFGVGFTAPSCTTFGCRLLSGKKRFSIDCLEVWGVGDEPCTEEEDATRPSVLDADPESCAMLQLVQGKMHSDGLRESAKMESPSETELPPM